MCSKSKIVNGIKRKQKHDPSNENKIKMEVVEHSYVIQIWGKINVKVNCQDNILPEIRYWCLDFFRFITDSSSELSSPVDDFKVSSSHLQLNETIHRPYDPYMCI